jgi:hypothetical protein
MTRKANLLERMKSNPRSVRFDELETILRGYGFYIHNYSGGSHYAVSHTKYKDFFGVNEPNVIPKKRPHVLPVYVKRAVVWIERVIEIEKSE